MMGYDFDVVYRKGASNVVADTLSRKPDGEFLAITVVHTDLFDRIQLTWTKDPQLVQLITQLQQGTKKHTKFTWQNQQLRRKGKLVVGNKSELRADILHYFHNSPTGGHSGVHPTMARISEVFY